MSFNCIVRVRVSSARHLRRRHPPPLSSAGSCWTPEASNVVWTVFAGDGDDVGARWVPIVSATAELGGFSSGGSSGMPFRQPEAEAFATAVAKIAKIPAEDVGGLYWHFDGNTLYVDFYVQLGREDGPTPDAVVASLSADAQLAGFLNAHGLGATAADVTFTSTGLVDAAHLPGIWGSRDHDHHGDESGGGGADEDEDDSEEVVIPEEELSSLDVSVVFPESGGISGSLGRKLLMKLLQDAVRTNPDDVNVMYIRIRRCASTASCPVAGVSATPALHPIIVGKNAFTTLQKVFDGETYVWRGRIGKLTPDDLAAGSQTRVFVDAARNFLDGYSNGVDGFSDSNFAQSLADDAEVLFAGVSNALTLRSAQTTTVLIVLNELADSNYDTIGSVSISDLESTGSGSTGYCDVDSEDCTTGGGPDGDEPRYTEVTGNIVDEEDGVIEYYWVVENAAEGGVEAYAIGNYDPGTGDWTPCVDGCRQTCDGCDVDASVVFTSTGCVDGQDVCTADLCLVAEDEEGGIAKQCTTIVVREQASTVGLQVEVQNKPYVGSIVAYEDDSMMVERGHFTAEEEWNQYCAADGANFEFQSCGIACQETLYLSATVSDPDSSGSAPTDVIDYQWYSDCAHFENSVGDFVPCLESNLADAAGSASIAACRGQATRVGGAFPPISTTIKQVGTTDGYRDCVVRMVMDDEADGEIDADQVDEAYGTALTGTGSIQLSSAVIYTHATSPPLRLDYDLVGHVKTPGFQSFESPRFRTSPAPQDQSKFDVFGTSLVQHLKSVRCYQITNVACAIVGTNDDVEDTAVFVTELVDTTVPFSGEGSATCRMRMAGACEARRLKMTVTQANTAGDVELPIYVDISCKEYGQGVDP